MPKGLYFTAVAFSFFLLSFFSTLNFWGHWTDLNQAWTFIIIIIIITRLWLLFEKFGPNACTPTGWGGGAKSLFWDWVWTLTEPNLQLNMISKIGKKTCQSIGTPLHTSQIWWFLVQKRLRTVGEFLPTPVPFKFLALGDTASLIVWTL